MWVGMFHAFGRAARGAVTTVTWTPRKDRKGLGRLPIPGGGRLSEAVLTAAAETGRAMLDRPSVRATLEAFVMKLLGGAGEPSSPVGEVRERAGRIAAILEERRVLPIRLAVDGLPGSGKSTLARALAEKLGMTWEPLDHENLFLPRSFEAERRVYEHHRLFRTQDVDAFEAIIYVDESVDVARARVLQRATVEAREAIITDVLDFDKLKRIGRLAFDVCEGDPVPVPGSPLRLKVRPPGGFRAMENIARRLRGLGHDAEGLGKEESLFLLLGGKPQSGLMAYFLPGAFRDELLQGLLAGMRRFLAE